MSDKFTEHYMKKDKDGKLVNDIFADLEKLNTNKKGECKCIQCDKIFIYKDTDVNMCKECVGEMFD